MKFYSEKTNKLYNSKEELESGEKELAEKEAEKAKLTEARKTRAEAIEAAYKDLIDTRKAAMEEASKKIKEKEDTYYELRSAFIKDYGSYHMTYSSTNDGDRISVSDFFDSVFDNFFIW